MTRPATAALHARKDIQASKSRQVCRSVVTHATCVRQFNAYECSNNIADASPTLRGMQRRPVSQSGLRQFLLSQILDPSFPTAPCMLQRSSRYDEEERQSAIPALCGAVKPHNSCSGHQYPTPDRAITRRHDHPGPMRGIAFSR